MSKISYNTLQKVIRESLETALIEEGLLNEVRTLKDNFDWWINYIDQQAQQLNDPDKVWFIQIMKRNKDNPGLAAQAKQQGLNYHAGAQYGTFGDKGAYIVHNGQELSKLRSEITKKANAMNARVVIWANPRSESMVNGNVQSFLARNHKIPKNLGKEAMYGRCMHDSQRWADRKICKFDIDTTDPMVHKLAQIIIKHYDPNAIFINDKSPSGGLHIGINDGYAQYVPEMIKMLRIADANPHNYFPDKGVHQTIHFNPDANFVLYSNVNTPGY